MALSTHSDFSLLKRRLEEEAITVRETGYIATKI